MMINVNINLPDWNLKLVLACFCGGVIHCLTECCVSKTVDAYTYFWYFTTPNRFEIDLSRGEMLITSHRSMGNGASLAGFSCNYHNTMLPK